MITCSSLILTDDVQTSNVFVANLPPHVTEQSLGNFFARMGPVGSVSVYAILNLSFAYLLTRSKSCGHAATARWGRVQI
jgi:RNA recognition motif-containing protein